MTTVYEVLRQDPDLEGAKFEILDYSAPKGGEPRELVIIDAQEIPILSEKRKLEMLAIFAEGFISARTHLASRVVATTDKNKPVEDARQHTLEDKWWQ